MLKAGQTTVSCMRCGHANTLGASTCAKCKNPFPDQSAATAMEGSASVESHHDEPGLARGTVIDGRYEIIDTLGSGGMGAVFKVFDRRLTRIVALKTIHPQ